MVRTYSGTRLAEPYMNWLVDTVGSSLFDVRHDRLTVGGVNDGDGGGGGGCGGGERCTKLTTKKVEERMEVLL